MGKDEDKAKAKLEKEEKAKREKEEKERLKREKEEKAKREKEEKEREKREKKEKKDKKDSTPVTATSQAPLSTVPNKPVQPSPVQATKAQPLQAVKAPAKVPLKVVTPPKPAVQKGESESKSGAIAAPPSKAPPKVVPGTKGKQQTAVAGPHVRTDESILSKTDIDATLKEALSRYAQYEKENDRVRQCVILNKIGLMYKVKNDLPRAIETMQKSLALAETLKNDSVRATILRNLGTLYLINNEHIKALKAHEESLRLKRTLGDKLGEAESEEVLANGYEDRGEFEKAVQHFRKALFIYDTLGDAGNAGRMDEEIERLEELEDEIFEEEYHTFQYTKSNQVHTLDIFHSRDFKEDQEI